MALIERKLGDGRNLTVEFHELPGYVVAKADGKVVIGKGVIGFLLPEPQTVNGMTFTHCIGESAKCKVGVGLTAEEARSILGKLEVRRQEAVAEAMKNATALEKGWEFEERSDRDADR
jgi:hypothetical protein